MSLMRMARCWSGERRSKAELTSSRLFSCSFNMRSSMLPSTTYLHRSPQIFRTRLQANVVASAQGVFSPMSCVSAAKNRML